jgi:mobilome CxxCx(11)CxxC protein
MGYDVPEEKRIECADSALRCYGTAYIFEKRACDVRRKLKFLTFLGIANPMVVGAVIYTYNLCPESLRFFLCTTGAVSTFQLILSVWALVNEWDNKLSNYLASKSDNYNLADKYDKLAKTTIMTKNEFEIKFSSVEGEATSRVNFDEKYDVSGKEKRMGMRFGLRRYQRSCAGCKKIPTTMESTECGICGQFGRSLWASFRRKR